VSSRKDLPQEVLVSREAAVRAPNAETVGSAADPIAVLLTALEAALDARTAEPCLRQLGQALSGADALRCAIVRDQAILMLREKVSAPAQLVDAALTPCRPAPPGQGRSVGFEDPAPWHEAVSGATLLQDLAAVLARYVALPAHADVAVALWTLHAHALAAAEISPILALISPEKRCGKTRMVSLLGSLVPRPVTASNITPASLFRAIERYTPTLLIDEAETFLGEREELRGLLNSGHSRSGAFVLRTSGDDFEPRRFSTWGAKVLALIGHLPDTLTDRSVVIPMRRRAQNERIERLRLDKAGEFANLCSRAARWAADHLPALREADPEVPNQLSDRAADNWRPLLAIADRAGGKWPQMARQAALAFSGEEHSQDSAREQLLGDIRGLFVRHGTERIFTEELLRRLWERDDRPWREWQAGAPLSAIQLAKLLKDFDIRPSTVRMGVVTGRGYKVADFQDAFARYLPTEPSHPSQAKQDGPFRECATHHTQVSVTGLESSANRCGVGIVTGVAGHNGDAS
jgi:Protein of unknown function (DUF3631)